VRQCVPTSSVFSLAPPFRLHFLSISLPIQLLLLCDLSEM
jgi:hypothetical protein